MNKRNNKNSYPRPSGKVAVLIDGGYFHRRFDHINQGSLTPKETADHLHKMARYHARELELYRIFYYDSSPFADKLHTPIGKKCIDYKKERSYIWRMKFFSEMKRLRKVALRLGTIKTNKNWSLKPPYLKKILSGELTQEDLTDDMFSLDFRQKGVDMKIGLDISSLSYKRQVSRIVLFSGDTDFVPAAKLARREGIDFVLDPMSNQAIDETLHEHIDGIQTAYIKTESAKQWYTDKGIYKK